jgi:uncharacterized membrane protein YdbT with pleckstrin-like domain
MEDEKTICEISPSQILNLGAFVISFIAAAAIYLVAMLTDKYVLLFLLLLPAVYSLWKWLQIKSVKLKITDQRIILREGIFSKKTNETELYRVRDFAIEEPFFYRMFGCGNIVVHTTDETNSILRLTTYKKPHWLKDQLRNYSEICRQKKRWGNDNVLLHEGPSPDSYPDFEAGV